MEKIVNGFIKGVYLLSALVLLIFNLGLYLLPFILAYTISSWWLCSMVMFIPIAVVLSKLFYWIYKFIFG